MSKTFQRVNKDDVERDFESPSHKNRREVRKIITSTSYFDNIDSTGEHDFEEMNENFERYEPIKRKRGKS